MKLLLTIIIAFTQLLAVIIPLKGKLTSNRKFPKNYTNRGYCLIACCFIATTCTILLFNITANDDDKNQKDLIIRDSINQNKIELANKNYIIKLDSSGKKTIELLAKYGLKIDSNQQRIEKLVLDSTKIINKTYNTEDPVFELCNVTLESQKENSIQFKHFYCSTDATSYSTNFLLDVICLTPKGQYYFIWKNKRIIQPSSIIKKGEHSSIGMTLPTFPLARYYIFHIKGSYKKFDGKIIPLDEITTYDLANDPKPHFGPPNAEMYEAIQDLIKRTD